MNISIKKACVLACSSVLLFNSQVPGSLAQTAHGSEAIIDLAGQFHPVVGRKGMVSSQEARASQIGVDILRQGGNAVDAAVAVGFALAVTLPKAGNIGGGGFMLVHDAKSKHTHAIDYRETAPAAAHRDVFLNKDGSVNKDKARNSFQSAGVPGTVAGLLLALKQHGSMKPIQVMAPAIKLAREGFVLSEELALELQQRHSQLSRSKAGQNIFYKKDGGFYKAGEKLIQKDLANTLERIALTNGESFYHGETADLIVKDSKRRGGLITKDDLRNYKPALRKAATGNYRGYDLVTMPPPSASGIHIIQMLNILENSQLQNIPHNSAAHLHQLSSAMQFAFADRSEHLGDPDFYDVPVDIITSKSYAKQLAEKIDPDHAKSAAEIKPLNIRAFKESPDTTHFSVIDQYGNAVSNTYTLNFSYGSGIVVKGAGFILNNEMDDFSAKPGVPNAFGLIGREANAIEAGKRPLSSMAPTIIFKNDKPFMITGSPGGSKIANAVLQTISNVIDYDMNIAQASSVPRIHHQWLPDVLNYESGISADTVKILNQMGYTTKTSKGIGSTQSILVKGGIVYGASDPRRPGAATIAE
ncbi:gamma-glutamyltransferase [Pseudoteredinibacter isoporae]|uniref:Glutathione hydrolase proenzyme n=1 Tax=Pseudoteredinibacter isoporae TaxID=570281 RepID=A0A7X0JRN3_9GAMM|nr:gamma-glutamyltransferase [Pseudoteredinibacter isoporae]MBB6520146.1 gamma-glutamyltranspeptidase/glutathione hydrolase [Pseudoteredinibacter isoporae]NHO85718.1 gamma-glutamyltransferase [Pseudoteredinibacter isoporae]NIB25830.1 gamma-glutamyltransferase [Pseudoteredinibacter isoporae]